MRLSHLSWLLIVVVAVTGEIAIRLSHQSAMEQFAAPVSNVPPFHVLSPSDVRPLWRPAAQIPRGAARNMTSVVGHVTMSALTANQPITAGELGPDVPGRAGGLTVVGVPATAAMALDGQLTAGETVGVLAAGGAKHGYTQVLVLSVSRSGTGSRPYVVMVAISPRTPRKLVAAMGAGTVTLVSQPAS